MHIIYTVGVPIVKSCDRKNSLSGKPERLIVYQHPQWNEDKEAQFSKMLSYLSEANLLVVSADHPDVAWLIGYAHGIGLVTIAVGKPVSPCIQLSVAVLCNEEEVMEVVEKVLDSFYSPDAFSQVLVEYRRKKYDYSN